MASRINPLTALTEPDHLARHDRDRVDGTDESNRFHIPTDRDARRRDGRCETVLRALSPRSHVAQRCLVEQVFGLHSS